MAVSIAYLEDDTIGKKCGHNFKMITGVLTFTTYEASTTTTGVALDLSNQIPTRVHFVSIEAKAGYVPVYDYVNNRVKVYEAGADGAALDEVADNRSLGATMSDTRIFAIGK